MPDEKKPRFPTPPPPDEPEIPGMPWQLAALASRIGGNTLGSLASATGVGSAIGGLLGGAGEAAAEYFENPSGSTLLSSLNPWRIAGEAALTAVPFGKVYKLGAIGSNIAKGAALAEAGNILRRWTIGQPALPSTPTDLAVDAGSTILGGVLGAIPGMKIQGKTSAKAPGAVGNLETALEDTLKTPTNMNPRPAPKNSGVVIRTEDPVVPSVAEAIQKGKATTISPEFAKQVTPLDQGIEAASELGKAQRTVNAKGDTSFRNRIIEKEKAATVGEGIQKKTAAAEEKLVEAERQATELVRLKAEGKLVEKPLKSTSETLTGLGAHGGKEKGTVKTAPPRKPKAGNKVYSDEGEGASDLFVSEAGAKTAAEKLGGDIEHTQEGFWKVVPKGSVKPSTPVEVPTIPTVPIEAAPSSTPVAPPTPTPKPRKPPLTKGQRFERKAQEIAAAAPELGEAPPPSIPTEEPPILSRGVLPIRTLSQNEEQGVSELEQLMNRIHGEDTPLPGNGTFRSDVPEVVGAEASTFSKFSDEVDKIANEIPIEDIPRQTGFLSRSPASKADIAGIERLKAADAARARGVPLQSTPLPTAPEPPAVVPIAPVVKKAEQELPEAWKKLEEGYNIFPPKRAQVEPQIKEIIPAPVENRGAAPIRSTPPVESIPHPAVLSDLPQDPTEAASYYDKIKSLFFQQKQGPLAEGIISEEARAAAGKNAFARENDRVLAKYAQSGMGSLEPSEQVRAASIIKKIEAEANKAQGIVGKIDPAVLAERVPDFEALPQGDRISKLKQLLDTLKKEGGGGLIGGETGEINPALLYRLGTGAIGAGVGAYAAPDDQKSTGALLGGLAGAASPDLVRLLAQRGVGEMTVPNLRSILQQVPNYQRAALLSDFRSLFNNAIAGPYGAGTLGGIEEILAGNPEQGKALLKEMHPISWGKRYFRSFPEAVERIGQNERGDFIGKPTGFLGRVLGAPATWMVMGDEATRGAGATAGLAEEVTRNMTSTGNPRSVVGQSLEQLGKHRGPNGEVDTITQMMFPFKRTLINLLESGLERTPGVGEAVNWVKHPTNFNWSEGLRRRMAEQGLGGAVMGGDYLAGKYIPEDIEKRWKLHNFFSNLSGRSAIPGGLAFMMGQASQRTGTGGNTAGKILSEVKNSIPLPSADFLTDLIKPGLKGLTGEPIELNPLAPNSDIPQSLIPKLFNLLREGSEDRDFLEKLLSGDKPPRFVPPPPER